MPQDIDAFAINRNAIPKEDGIAYVDMFQLKDVFEAIENQSKLNEFILFFAIEDNEDNRYQLEATFGRNWQDNFIRRLRLPDNQDDIKMSFNFVETGESYDSARDIMDDAGIYYDANAYDPGTYDETMYKYFPKADFFKTLNNERAGIVISLGYDISIGYDGDSWFKQIVSIIAVILITWFFPPAAPYAAATYFMAGVSIFFILTEMEMPLVLQIVMSVVGLGTGFAGVIGGQFILDLANLALKIAEVYESQGVEKELNELQEQKEELEAKFDAENFGRQTKFIFGSGFFKSYLNDGVHKDPYQFIYDSYNPYRTYKNTSYNMWDQID